MIIWKVTRKQSCTLSSDSTFSKLYSEGQDMDFYFWMKLQY